MRRNGGRSVSVRERIDDHTKLKSQYGCDLVLKNNQQCFLYVE